MSYLTQALLVQDADFNRRVRAVNVQQALYFQSQETSGPDIQKLCDAILMDSAGPVNAFVRLDAAGPGISDKVDNGDGTIDSTLVTDGDLLSLTQTNFPIVADLYFPTELEPK